MKNIIVTSELTAAISQLLEIASISTPEERVTQHELGIAFSNPTVVNAITIAVIQHRNLEQFSKEPIHV